MKIFPRIVALAAVAAAAAVSSVPLALATTETPAASQPATVSESAPDPANKATSTLPANSPVPLRFLQTVSSATHTRGQQFELELTDDITVGDSIVIPAGSVVTAEVIHAQKAGMLGKAGELIVAARYVTLGSRQIRLRAQLMKTGRDKTVAALFVVPFIRGKDLVFPAQTEVIARTVSDETFTK